MLYSFTVDFVRSSVFRPEHQTLLVRISELRECYRVSSALSRPVLPECAAPAPAILPKTHTSLTSLSLASNSQPRLVESSTGELDRRWLWFCLVECRVLVFSQCSAVQSVPISKFQLQIVGFGFGHRVWWAQAGHDHPHHVGVTPRPPSGRW